VSYVPGSAVPSGIIPEKITFHCPTSQCALCQVFAPWKGPVHRSSSGCRFRHLLLHVNIVTSTIVFKRLPELLPQDNHFLILVQVGNDKFAFNHWLVQK